MLALLLIASCSSKQDPQEETAINRFEDPQLQIIYDFQDQRNSNALIPYLKAKKLEHREAAALAFASIKDSAVIPYLAQMAQADQDEDARRAAIYALGQIGHSKAYPALQRALSFESSRINIRYILESIGKCADEGAFTFLKDYRSKDSLLSLGWVYGLFRAQIKGMADEESVEAIENFLMDSPEEQASVVASHYLYRYYRSNSMQGREGEVKNIIANLNHNEAKDRLSLLFMPKQQFMDFNEAFRVEYSIASDYRKAELIKNLEMNPSTVLPFLQKRFEEEEGVVRLAAYERILEAYSAMQTETHSQWFMKGFKSGDMALASTSAIALLDYSLSPETRAEAISLVDSLRKNLQLPRQVETYNDLSKVLAHWNQTEYKAYKVPYNHSIDWAHVLSLEEGLNVLIKTSKGDIRIQCHVNEAPGSVSNFIKLVDSGYYDGKYFHRVVPNFVIQGGCPRGDGWGSLNWTQRSEFSNYLNYVRGAVGLASSGNDTEGVQFFITHCQTPHLDGRYTIFASVVEGMDVVDRIGVGDQILSITRI